MRADIFLVENGFARSRSEAQAAIRGGLVRIDGALVAKPSQAVSIGAVIEYAKPHPFVSRGGVKLVAALDHFGLSPEGRIGLDLGASTGGFTQVLLQRGAARVHAVDVGHNQMNANLALDPRIVIHDGINARELNLVSFPDEITAVTADLSFISLKLALPPALSLASDGAWAVLLVKPQFEVGRGAIGKGGIVRDPAVRQAVPSGIAEFIEALAGWRVLGSIESPIAGGDGNVEYLLAAVKQ